MGKETKIGMKIEEETKYLTKMCEKIGDAINHELDKGIEKVNTEELGEAVDMLKDLYEAKEKMVKSCYYKQVMEAMEEHDFENEEEIMEEGRKGYRGRSKDSMGRFTSRGRGRRGYEMPMMMYDEDWDEMERMRDMDRNSGRMGYSGSQSTQSSGGMNHGGQSSSNSQNTGNSRGYEEGYYKGYEEGSRGNQRDSREGRSGQSRRGYMESKEMHKGNSADDKQHKMKELENYMKDLSEDVTEMITDMSPEEKSMLKSKMQVLIQKIS